jgi:hypothetical protein
VYVASSVDRVAAYIGATISRSFFMASAGRR